MDEHDGRQRNVVQAFYVTWRHLSNDDELQRVNAGRQSQQPPDLLV